MRITVLFDEETLSTDLAGGFGLSLLINDSVLFDTGSDAEKLLHNMRVLGIDLSKIRTVVLSHKHWDHTDGLARLLPALPKPNVHICPDFPHEIRRQIVQGGAIAVTGYTPAQIAADVYASGEMPGLYRNDTIGEQSLVVTGGDSRGTLVSGCAHYGIAQAIDEIQERISRCLGRDVSIDSIVGGLHLSHVSDSLLGTTAERLRRFGIRRVAPLHCTGDAARKAMGSQFGKGFHDLKVGSHLEI